MRRRDLAALMVAPITGSLHLKATAQQEAPLRMVIAFATGGSADALGRLVGEGLARRIQRPVIPDNRPGASGTIGTGAVAKAAGDGNTILMATSSSHYSAYLYKSVPYNVERDLVPVAGIATVPLLVVARPGLQANNMAELVALAKRQPGKITYASPGSGGAAHLATEMFARAAGVELLHVPYKGVAAGVTDVMGERIDFMFDSVSTSGPHVKTGTLKALGMSSLRRSPAMPSVPAISETVPGFDATYWLAIFAPAATPRATIERLNAEINAVLRGEAVQQRITDIGGVLRVASSDDFGRYLDADSRKWRQVILDTGVKVD